MYVPVSFILQCWLWSFSSYSKKPLLFLCSSSCSILCPLLRDVCQQHVLFAFRHPTQTEALSGMLAILARARNFLQLSRGRSCGYFPLLRGEGLGRMRVGEWFPGILNIPHNESFDFFLRNRAVTWPTRDPRHEAWSGGEKLRRGMSCCNRGGSSVLCCEDSVTSSGQQAVLCPERCGFLSSHVTTS